MTEPGYLRDLERSLRNATLKIEIPQEHGEPRQLVEIAKRAMHKARAEARAQGDAFIAYDETWCVFDRDEHLKFKDACKMAEDNGIRLAISNPCFELWLLLHFRESPGMQSRSRLQEMLRSYLPGYRKRANFVTVSDGLDAATRRAHRLHQDA